MTLSEVEILMQELNRHVNECTQILFGTAVDGRMGNRLAVTIISSLHSENDVASNVAAPLPVQAPIWEQPQETAPNIDILPEPSMIESAPAAEVIPFEPPPPIAEAPPPIAPVEKSRARVIMPRKKIEPEQEPKPVRQKFVQAKQEVLQFEPVTRGRFEKSEPTIIEGQDLDVPTFLRKNIRVK
jgi:cell division protein FtsZ